MRFLAYSLKVKRPHSPDAHERGHAKKPKVCYLPVKVNSDASYISITNPSNKVTLSIPLTNLSNLFKPKLLLHAQTPPDPQYRRVCTEAQGGWARV